MANKQYPVMIGANMKKGVVAYRNMDMGGFDLCVVWLKREIVSGETFGVDDIEGVNTILHFCDRTSVMITKGVLQNILRVWEEGKETAWKTDA